MKTETLNENLIAAIRDKIPKGASLANVLMDTLYIGKEAVYRRLRGEVPFTFTEASVISNALGVSLDRISGNHSSNNALITLNVIDYKHPRESFRSNIENGIQIFQAVKDNPTTEWCAASNVIPQVFYMDHDNLSKFLLYKWMYQHEKINYVKLFSEFTYNDDLRDLQREYVKVSREVASTTFIWDNMMFVSLISDIQYFLNINLIKRKEVEILKEETIRLIDGLEEMATKGEHGPGRNIRIYISNINFEASYGYIEADDFRLSTMRVYSINEIATADLTVFEHQKNWINSLKKYSTLISVSSELQRIQYFEKQRQYVRAL